LEAGVAANPGAFGDFAQEGGGVFFLERSAVGDAACPPFPGFESGEHEGVADADGEVFVLVHDAAVGVAIVGAVVTLFDQGPGFLFLLLFGVNEFFDVAVPVAQGVHLGGAAGFAAGFDDVGDLVIDLEKGERPLGRPPPESFSLLERMGEVGAGAGAVF